MATNFPSSLDNATSLPYPSATDDTNSPSLSSGQDNQNDALIAVETKLGTGSSTPSGTYALVSTGTGTSSWSLATPTSTIVGISDTQTLTNKTIDASNNTISNLSGSDLASNTITATQIANATITATQIATNGVGASNLATNAIKLGYAQITSTFNGTTSTSWQAVTGLSVTVTIPSGGRSVKISAYTEGIYTSTGGAYVRISIWDGTVGSGTQLSQWTANNSAADDTSGAYCVAVVTPAAGSKTYNVGIQTSTAADAPNLEASSIFPAFILVEMI